jgi:hypothetical protein
MSCTRHAVLKVVVKIVSSECDAYPTVSAYIVEGHLVKSVPIISYACTRPIASTKFNYNHVLCDLNIDYFKSKTPDCTCASSPFILIWPTML